MNVPVILPHSLRRTLLYTGVALVFALGCNTGVPSQVDVAVEAESCIDGALSMTFTVASTQALFLPQYQYGSPNIIGIPTMVPGTNSFFVTADLDTLALGEVVSMNFGAAAQLNASIGAQNIEFYAVPAAQLPQPSGCPPTQGPVIGTGDLPGLGFHLTISNPTPEPITLDQLELAETSTILPSTMIGWGNPVLESLAWQSPLAPGTMLMPGTPPLVVDLPDVSLPATHGTLLRYASTHNGQMHRAIVQADLVGGTVTITPTTWGAVKALYRD